MSPFWPESPHARFESLLRRQDQHDTDLKRLFRRLPSLEQALLRPIPSNHPPPPFICTHVKTVAFDGSDSGALAALPPQAGFGDGRGLNFYTSFFNLSPDLTLAQFEIVISDGTSGWSVFNGTHVLQYDATATNSLLRIITWTKTISAGISIRVEQREGSDIRIGLSDNNAPLRGHVWRKTDCAASFVNFASVNPEGLIPTLISIGRV